MKKKPFDFRTIKSFEDACKKEGIDPAMLPDVSMLPQKFREAVIAVYKLFVIFKAINDKWIADYTNNDQPKYYPWLRVNSSGSGFDFSDSYFDYDRSDSAVGSRLCTFSREAALYIGEQFAPEYAKFFL